MEHKELVSKIYSVHEELRLKRRENKGKDWDLIWKNHTKNLSCLQEYAESMHKLATKIWEPRNAAEDADSEEKLKCRLDWVHLKCREYFKDNIREEKLKLLDVGSCYNPFKKFSNLFDITAIDLCPAPGLAEGEVLQCDFLELKLHTNNNKLIIDKEGRLESIQKEMFDVIVFSFFLEYLPDKKQRLESCGKAAELLKPGGILFILRPDSGSVTPKGNNRLVKGLKVGCALLGLKRQYFDKLEHLWCMGFVKLVEEEKEIYLKSGRFLKEFDKVRENFDIKDSDSFEELFSISQDFKEVVEISEQERVEVEPKLFDELPNFGSEDERLEYLLN